MIGNGVERVVEQSLDDLSDIELDTASSYDHYGGHYREPDEYHWGHHSHQEYHQPHSQSQSYSHSAKHSSSEDHDHYRRVFINIWGQMSKKTSYFNNRPP